MTCCCCGAPTDESPDRVGQVWCPDCGLAALMEHLGSGETVRPPCGMHRGAG